MTHVHHREDNHSIPERGTEALHAKVAGGQEDTIEGRTVAAVDAEKRMVGGGDRGDRGDSHYSGSRRRDDDRRPAYDERQRNKERDRDRETYDRNGGRHDRERTGLGGSSSRRSASPSRRARPLTGGTGERSHSPDGSKSPGTAEVDKSKPNFAPSGLLAAATNTVQAADGTSTVLKYNEPPEARKPILSWRLYVFKGSEQVGASSCHSCASSEPDVFENVAELMHIHRASAYLIGRDKTVADIVVDHPSCSKQHAVIQCAYKLMTKSLTYDTDVVLHL